MWEIIHREGYDQQVRRSAEAVASWLGCRPRARLVLLRAGGEVKVIEEMYEGCLRVGSGLAAQRPSSPAAMPFGGALFSAISTRLYFQPGWKSVKRDRTPIFSRYGLF